MKEPNEFSDDFVRNAVKDSRKILSNDSLENQIMLKIYAEKKYKDNVLYQLRRSLQFFIGALFLSLGLMAIIAFGDVYTINNTKIAEVLSLFFIMIIGILNIDNYRRLIGKFVV